MRKLSVESATAIDITMDICGVLMENGADISRIEASARDLCSTLEIRLTGILVIPSFITISYIDKNHKSQTVSSRHLERGTNLSKIEGACNLISKIQHGQATLKEICIEINSLKSNSYSAWYTRLITYIGVASIFTFVFGGVSLVDRLSSVEIVIHLICAALCSIVVFGTDIILSKANISDIFSKALSAILLMISLHFCGIIVNAIGQYNLYSAYILMGNIMLIVPGIKFTNGVRDLFSGDVASATIHVVEAVFATLGIALGIILMQQLLSTSLNAFSAPVHLAEASIEYVLASVLFAGFGTMSFALYFRIDRQHTWLSFFAGAATWIVFTACTRAMGVGAADTFRGEFFPNFLAALVATMISEGIAHKKEIPSMIILFPAIVTLIPGGSLYKAIDSVINSDSLYTTKMITNTLFAAGGISCGVLIVASIGRIGMSLVDSIDFKSANVACLHEHRDCCQKYTDEAKHLYNIARRHMSIDSNKAFLFHEAAQASFQRATDEIKSIEILEGTLQHEDAVLRYDVYLNAGINLFWMYKCKTKEELTENMQKEYLEKAIQCYNCAEAAATEANIDNKSERDRKKGLLQNWMAVMKINMARFESDTKKKNEYITEAEGLLESARAQYEGYANIYLNLAEVVFERISIQLGIEYGTPITLSPTMSCIDDQKVTDGFQKIEDNLYRAIFWNPKMINAYYKLAQLQTFKIFYFARYKKKTPDDLYKYQLEAEKWLMQASTYDQYNSGYLYICREYYEFINLERAKDVNCVIRSIDPIAAKKWEQQLGL